MIFLSITGSFAAAVAYDKYQTKRIRQKWCDLVSPLAEETLPPSVLPRRITVYIEAQPADGLRNAREHFHEYIKPTLVAAAMDWDVVEGRREGDVRYGTAERIRRFRRRRGEAVAADEEKSDSKTVVEDLRESIGTQRQGPPGDLVVGRHAWKEYVRGLHEGWLGPVSKPVPVTADLAGLLPESAVQTPSTPTMTPDSTGDAAVVAATEIAASQSTVTDDASPAAQPTTPEPEEKKEEDKPKKLSKPDPYISTSAYPSAQLPSSIPQELAPTTVIPVPHILGFWNFPIRIYRFLNRRHLADDIGRRTAALVLASSRPVDGPAETQGVLEHEEGEWHKSVRKRDRSDGEESAWLDEMVIDERIGERMRVAELTRHDEENAEELFRRPRSGRKEDEE